MPSICVRSAAAFMFNYFRPHGGAGGLPDSWKPSEEVVQAKQQRKRAANEVKKPKAKALPAPVFLPPPPQPEPAVAEPVIEPHKPKQMATPEPRGPAPRAAPGSPPARPTSRSIRSNQPRPVQEEDPPPRAIVGTSYGYEQPSKRPACRSPTALLEAIQQLILEADMEDLPPSPIRRTQPKRALPNRHLEPTSRHRCGRSQQQSEHPRNPPDSIATESMQMVHGTPIEKKFAAEKLAPVPEPSLTNVQGGMQASPQAESTPRPTMEASVLALTEASAPATASERAAAELLNAISLGLSETEPLATAPAALPVTPMAAPPATEPPAAEPPAAEPPAAEPPAAEPPAAEAARHQAFATESVLATDDATTAADDEVGGQGIERCAALGGPVADEDSSALPLTTSEEAQMAIAPMMQMAIAPMMKEEKAPKKPDPDTKKLSEPLLQHTSFSAPAEQVSAMTVTPNDVHVEAADGELPTPELISTASAEDSFSILLTDDFNSDAALVESALIRLSALCSQRRTSRSHSIPLILGNGMQSIVRSLDAHADSEPVQAAGWNLISRLTSSETRKQEATDGGVFAAVVSAFHKHPSSLRVGQLAGFAVLKLTQDSVLRCHLAIAAGLQDALSFALAELESQVSKEAKTKELASLYLAQAWLQMHADLAAGPNHFVRYSSTAAARRPPLRLKGVASASDVAAAPESSASKAPFEWSYRASPKFARPATDADVRLPPRDAWSRCLQCVV